MTMLEYCNVCESFLQIDIFYSYKKSTGKECLNKKLNAINVVKNLIVLIYLST